MNPLINKFLDYCLEYEQACILNEYRTVNQKHDLVQKTFLKIKESNLLSELLPLLENKNETVRLWTATKLLPYFEDESRKVLENIIKLSPTNSSSAKIILDTHDGKELSFP